MIFLGLLAFFALVWYAVFAPRWMLPKFLPARRRPDYALIQNLEHELGLVPEGGHDGCALCMSIGNRLEASMRATESQMALETYIEADRARKTAHQRIGLVWPDQQVNVQFNPDTQRWERH